MLKRLQEVGEPCSLYTVRPLRLSKRFEFPALFSCCNKV